MLRWTILCCAVLAVTAAHAADQLAPKSATQRAQHQLPPGLPRPHYKARTTVVYGPPPVVVAPDPDVLISIPSTPFLLGSTTLPGYYGRAFDYDYQGPYYGGGGYVPYQLREPYACGVTGYC